VSLSELLARAENIFVYILAKLPWITAGLVLIVAFVFGWSSNIVERSVLQALKIQPIESSGAAEKARKAEEEVTKAEQDNIENMIVRCRQVNISKITDYDANNLYLNELTMVYNPYPPRTSTTDEVNKFEPEDLSILYLNRLIGLNREDCAENAVRAHHSMSIWKIVTVLIAFITTILVGLKASLGFPHSISGKRAVFSVGVLALISSAAGTGAAAFSAFYGPEETYNNSTRSLNDLRKLHARISATLSQYYQPATCKAPANEAALSTLDAVIRQWAAQYAATLPDADQDKKASGS
jgi:hypothetical protein